MNEERLRYQRLSCALPTEYMFMVTSFNDDVPV